ncbi:hypothetical protein MDA_GLEAN10004757 [Myotis davidii]|uniref:Uncharacterized protein n=1 Tax=Myotis davidii TaxID=225400 RepID=L5M3V5_MYODS|nr:hypothetical protein MDA_GLEAN10004757 [Myotis davidii]
MQPADPWGKDTPCDGLLQHLEQSRPGPAPPMRSSPVLLGEASERHGYEPLPIGTGWERVQGGAVGRDEQERQAERQAALDCRFRPDPCRSLQRDPNAALLSADPAASGDVHTAAEVLVPEEHPRSRRGELWTLAVEESTGRSWMLRPTPPTSVCIFCGNWWQGRNGEDIEGRIRSRQVSGYDQENDEAVNSQRETGQSGDASFRCVKALALPGRYPELSSSLNSALDTVLKIISFGVIVEAWRLSKASEEKPIYIHGEDWADSLGASVLKDRNAQSSHERAEGFRAWDDGMLLLVQPRSGGFQGSTESRL